MRPKRAVVPALDDFVAAMLIGGWCAKPPGRTQTGFGETLPLWTEGDRYIADLWRSHEGYLRVLAEQWAIAPSWELENGTVAYFGEYVAHGGR